MCRRPWWPYNGPHMVYYRGRKLMAVAWWALGLTRLDGLAIWYWGYSSDIRGVGFSLEGRWFKMKPRVLYYFFSLCNWFSSIAWELNPCIIEKLKENVGDRIHTQKRRTPLGQMPNGYRSCFILSYTRNFVCASGGIGSGGKQKMYFAFKKWKIFFTLF